MSIEHVEQAHSKIKLYEQRYGCDYKTFSTRVQTDVKFLARIESINPLWEEDAMEWGYRVEELKEWSKTLQGILRK